MHKDDDSSLDWVNKPLRDWFVGQLKRHTKEPLNAFEKLCHKGCDKNFLVWQFATLATPPSLEPLPLPPKFKDFRNAPKSKIEMFPLDHWDTATGGLTPEDLDAIADRARKLISEIQRLRDTTLVKILAGDHSIYGRTRRRRRAGRAQRAREAGPRR